MKPEGVLAWLREQASEESRIGMKRYGIPNDNALGVPMGVLKRWAKGHGADHDLALELWSEGLYETRTVAVLVDEPELVTSSQMDAWADDFDSWAICDTACFHLFDRTAERWAKVAAWAESEREFVKRAAFALVWALSVHDKKATDARFVSALDLVRDAAGDDRTYVKKGVDMALRSIGKRNASLHAAAIEVARELSEDGSPSRSWIGRRALRELSSEKVRARLPG